jgi:TRAP-type C4-dicarboxylate transport system substrate-binding protein
LVDGIEVPLIAMESYKFYEVTKYASITNHEWQAYNIISNPDAWHRLPKTLQDLVEGVFGDAQAQVRADNERDDQRLVAALRAKGMTFNEADGPSFRQAVRKAGLYAQWRSTFGNEAWTLLERSVGKLS